MTNGEAKLCALSIIKLGVPVSAVLQPSPARDVVEREVENLKNSGFPIPGIPQVFLRKGNE